MSQEKAFVSGWRKSSRCDSSACVEVRMRDEEVAVRDTTRPEVQLTVDGAGWRGLLRELRRGNLS